MADDTGLKKAEINLLIEKLKTNLQNIRREASMKDENTPDCDRAWSLILNIQGKVREL